jgi:DNA-binding CsgD family transcriptional regulator
MSTPFVARDAQVTALDDAVARASAGMAGAVLVAGDAGVGKTRLVEHAARRAREQGACVVVAHCVDLGEIGVPYLPFADALARVREHDPEAVDAVVAARPALARLLPGTAAGPLPDDQTGRLQLFEGIAEALGAVGSAGRPLILVLEDVHWADASSRDVLRFVVARLHEQHLLVVASYRTDDLHRRHPWRPLAAELARHPRVSRVDLPPFSPDELRAFATAVAGRPLPEAELQQVADRSEGNAYFAEELIEAGPNAAMPWSLADVLRGRLDVLDPSVQELARLASAAGRTVSEPLLRAAAAGSAALSEPGAFDHALRIAVAHHVLVIEQNRLAFRHALLAEAVYTDLLPGEKSALHRAYLAAMTADPTLGPASQLASHALLAPDLAVAMSASRRAANSAHRMLAPAEELRHLEVVLRLWDTADEPAADHVATLRTAAAAAAAIGQVDRAVQLARVAVDEVADDPLAQAELRTELARRLLDAEKVQESFDEATAAVTALGPEPTRVRAWALATLARAALNIDRDVDALQGATAAVGVAREAGAADAESDALTTLAVLDVDDPDRVAELLTDALERAVDACDTVTELRVRFNLTSSRFYAGDLDSAERLAVESVERAQAEGLPWHVYSTQMALFRELIAYTRGDLSRRDPARGAPDDVAPWLLAVGLHAAVARGDEDAVARGVALESEWKRDPQIALISGGATIDALVWQGRIDEALDLADRLIEFLTRTWWDYFLGVIWLAALAIGGLADTAAGERLQGRDPALLVARGRALLDRAELAVERGRPRGGPLGPEGRAWLARARAESQRLAGVDDVEAWRTALREFGYGYVYEEARTRWRLAEALVGVGDRAAAATEARAALEAATAMGAAPLAAAVRDLMRRARLEGAGARPAGDLLTAREAEVLELVARGLTNGQIGERLFISTKTASVHVSNLLAKLGASGRAEAVSIAHQRGLLDQPVSSPGA